MLALFQAFLMPPPKILLTVPIAGGVSFMWGEGSRAERPSPAAVIGCEISVDFRSTGNDMKRPAEPWGTRDPSAFWGDDFPLQALLKPL
jgi:hypothetical protein